MKLSNEIKEIVKEFALNLFWNANEEDIVNIVYDSNMKAIVVEVQNIELIIEKENVVYAVHLPMEDTWPSWTFNEINEKQPEAGEAYAKVIHLAQEQGIILE